MVFRIDGKEFIWSDGSETPTAVVGPAVVGAGGFRNHVVASAMIDRIVHHADVITLKENSCRLKDTPTRLASEKPKNKAQ